MADQDPTAGTPDSRSTAPRLAHDLRAIREARNVTLDEVQRETRMPGDILRRFEAGDLIGDSHYNEVYLRNLLKSYAQALGISPQEVTSAYERAKSGAYEGDLRRRYLEGKAAEPDAVEAPEPERAAPPEPTEPEAPESEAAEPAPPKTTSDTPAKKPPTTGGTAPAVAALSSRAPKKKPVEEPATSRSSEPMPKRRVSSATATSQPIEKSWGLIIGGTVAALLVIGLVLWFLFRDPSPEPEVAEAPPTTEDTTAAPAGADTAATAPPPASASTAPQFQTPITLTVVATDNPLEEFRVKVDDDARKPYWLEPGTEQTFTGQQEVVVWGELNVGESGGGRYDGARLRVQGLEWTPPNGRVVRLNQQTGQALLDSLSRAGNAGTTG